MSRKPVCEMTVEELRTELLMLRDIVDLRPQPSIGPVDDGTYSPHRIQHTAAPQPWMQPRPSCGENFT